MNPEDAPGSRQWGGPVSGLSNRIDHEVVYQMATLGGSEDVGKGKAVRWEVGHQDFPGDPS